MRHGNGFPLYGELDHGIDFHGSRGTLRISRRRFSIFPEGSDEPSAHVEAKDLGEMHMDIPHKRNWIQCIRDRRKQNSDAEDGHRSSI